MLSHQNIICVSTTPWDFLPLVMHHMMKLLSAQNRVLFVNPVVSPVSAWLHGAMAKQRQASRSLDAQQPRELAPNLWLCQPRFVLPLPFGHLPLVDRWSRRRMGAAIRHAQRALGMTDPILWCYDPFSVEPRGQFGERLVVFDCNDDHSGWTRFPHKRHNMRRRQEDFAARADVTFVTARHLEAWFRPLAKSVHYFPSGVDFGLFHSALAPEVAVAPELAAIPRPIAGYVGALFPDRIAWDWLKALADSNPPLSVVLIGPALDGEPPADIRQHPRIALLGPRKQAELPHYLKAFDVAMIPYRGELFLKSCQPTKTYEYLAAGLPVVSSAIPELETMAGYVRVARDPEGFVRAIRETIQAGREPATVERLVACAREHTWAARAEGCSAILEPLLRNRTRP